MKTAQQIKQQLFTVVEACGVFDIVLLPSDDRRENVVMREPAAAIYLESISKIDDKGAQLAKINLIVLMKFLAIGLNDSSEDIELVMSAIAELEPTSITQRIKSAENKRSSIYQIDVSFVGCRS